MNATETYQANRLEIDAKIARIQDLLKAIDKSQSTDPKNWGFAGTAGHINSELDSILETLGANEPSM
jgi:hypothetical protein